MINYYITLVETLLPINNMDNDLISKIHGTHYHSGVEVQMKSVLNREEVVILYQKSGITCRESLVHYLGLLCRKHSL